MKKDAMITDFTTFNVECDACNYENDLHRNVTARSEKLRRQAKDRHGRKKNALMVKFVVGGFVFVGLVLKYPNILTLNWKGPYRVSRVNSDYVMEVQQLVEPYETALHHESRLKFFRDADLDVTSDLIDYAAFSAEGFYV
ncbi:hypothetical protein DYB32_008955 [Aphanomyces invadans]|uniref:Transmembrane protein n=1 Tax=Aphanomyces invadans TaxID=157072 RepID=A0A3R6V4W2_9STRA|nr:hypothetical protein DYB32_008955 [Aphanomyces invadans]